MTKKVHTWSRLLHLWAVALMLALPLAAMSCGGDDTPPAEPGPTTETPDAGKDTGVPTPPPDAKVDGTTPAGSKVATPTLSPAGGTYTGAQNVQISTSTPNAKIYYTTDGNNPTDGSTLYSKPIAVAKGSTTIKAFAKATGFSDSDVASATYVIADAPVPQAAAPTFDPAGGTYAAAQNVKITSTTPNAQIRYTLDGNAPNAGSTLYAAPIAVSSTTTIKAIAIAANFTDSPVSAATYTFMNKTVTPVFSLPEGTYDNAQTVQITCATPGATIFYTTDGTVPKSMSILYTMPISVSKTMTIQAFAVAAGLSDSAVAKATYTIKTALPAAATPTFTPAGGMYTTVQTVTIASATAGAAIHFTLDETEPTSASTLYTAPLTISNQRVVVKAFASAANFSDSPAATAIYTINIPMQQAVAPTITPNGGTTTAPVQVTLATTEPNGTIIYTTNGTLPSATNGSVYGGPFTLAQSATVNAVTTAPNKQNSNLATATFTVNIPVSQVTPVTIAPSTTTSDNDVNVTLTSTTAGATICYTTDGAAPTCSAAGACQTGQTYGGIPVVINRTATVLTTIACKASMTASSTTNATYTLNTGAVVFSPAAGSVTYGTTVTMTTTTGGTGVSIRYRTDGVAPTCTTGTLYDPATTAGRDVFQNVSFQAVACKANYGPTPATVQSGAYTVRLLDLTAMVPSGTVNDSIAAASAKYTSIYASNPGATIIMCLTQGATSTTPVCNAGATACTTGTLVATTAATVGTTRVYTTDDLAGALVPPDANAVLTVSAIACAPNFLPSNVTTTTYTFKVATPTFSYAAGTATIGTGAGINNTIATTTADDTIRWYDYPSTATLPTLSCTATWPPTLPIGGAANVTASNGTRVEPTFGGFSLGAIGCKTNYLPSDPALAAYPLPGVTASPVFAGIPAGVLNNDVAIGAVQITDTSIANVGETLTPAVVGKACFTVSPTGTIDCTEGAAPACGGTASTEYTWNATTLVSNVPGAAITGNGITLRAIACAPNITKSAIVTRTFQFEVAPVTITPPAGATGNTIGIGEAITFSSTTTGTTFKWNKGNPTTPPADPTCTGTTDGSSSTYTVLNTDNVPAGGVQLKVIGCRTNYASTAVATTNMYTSFRGGAAAFGIAAGTYGDTFEASSSNTPSGLITVNAGGGVQAPSRICVTMDGSTPACAADGSACTGTTTTQYFGGAPGVATGASLPWTGGGLSLDDGTSGFTLRALPCYGGVNSLVDPPVTVTGPYNFQMAPLTVANITTTPLPGLPYTTTQVFRYRVGNEASTGVTAVKAPAATALGLAKLCYTANGAVLGTGCATSSPMTCLNTRLDTVSATGKLFPDANITLNAKACKSILVPAVAPAQSAGVAAYTRTLAMDGSNEFFGRDTTEGFNTSPVGDEAVKFYVTYSNAETPYLYVGWQGCGINPTGALNAGNVLHMYIGKPGQQGTNMQRTGFYNTTQAMTAFAAGDGGAFYHLTYDVMTRAVDLKVANLSVSPPTWGTSVASHGVTAVQGSGTSSNCSAGADEGGTGDWVIVRLPLASIGSPRNFAIASALWDATVGNNTNGWPIASVTNVPFRTVATTLMFDRLSWRTPSGADGAGYADSCWALSTNGGFDYNRATCQFPASYNTTINTSFVTFPQCGAAATPVTASLVSPNPPFTSTTAGVSIRCTSAVGSTPADPSSTDTLCSALALASGTYNVKAKAFVPATSDCSDSAVASIVNVVP